MANKSKVDTPEIKTITIDNFSGVLTSELIGTLNSGLVPISQNPYGKLPFGNPYKQKALQFVETPYALTGTAPTQVIVQTIKGGTFNIGGISSLAEIGFDVLGAAYVVQVSDIQTPAPDKDTIVKYGGVTNVTGATLAYSGGLFWDGTTGTTGTLVLGTDAAAGSPTYGAYYMQDNLTGIISGGNFYGVATGSGVTLSYGWNGTGWCPSVPRPFCKFLGTLYEANQNQLVSFNSSYTTIVNGGILSPPLPPDYTIKSLQVSNDGRYMIILASNGVSGTALNIYEQPQQTVYQPIDSIIGYWSGAGASTALSSVQLFKGLNITAVVQSSTDTIMFAKDVSGVGIFDLSGNTLARIDDVGSQVYPPSPQNIDAIGKLFFFMIQVGTSVNIYCFDSETRNLYPIYSDTGHTSGCILGALSVPSLHSQGIFSQAWKDVSRVKLYYFIQDAFPNYAVYKQYSIHLQNYGGVVSGNYATQIQEFGTKVKPLRARIYTLPTATGNNFTFQLWDTQLNSLATKTYGYTAGTNPTLAQGSLSMMQYDLQSRDVSGFGVSIAPGVQGGTSSSFYVEKVEVDYMEISNPPTH